MVSRQEQFYLDCMRVNLLRWIWPVLLTACTQPDVTRSQQMKYAVLPAQLERLPQQNNGPAWNRYGLTGRVKHVETHWYSARMHNGNAESLPLRVGSVLYQHEALHFTADGQLSESRIGEGDTDTVAVHQYYQYDSASRLMAYIYSRGSRKAPETHYVYDASGQLTESIRQHAGSTQVYRETFQYSAGGDDIQVLVHADAKTIAARRYFLDEAQRITAYQYSNPPGQGKINFEIRYAYDDAGHVLTETNLDERGVVTHTIRYTWNNGQCVRSEAFDENNQRIGEEVYTYETDDYGNWTRKVVWILGKPWVMAERKLVYY
jgi:YD repeat-containing protein